jgi:enoyl-CoA hydratase/carnithine racemase
VIFSALRRLVGALPVEQLAVIGLLVSPDEASTLGLVDAVVPAEQLVDAAIKWCEALLALPEAAMNLTRREARLIWLGSSHEISITSWLRPVPGGGVRRRNLLFTAWWINCP